MEYFYYTPSVLVYWRPLVSKPPILPSLSSQGSWVHVFIHRVIPSSVFGAVHFNGSATILSGTRRLQSVLSILYQLHCCLIRCIEGHPRVIEECCDALGRSPEFPDGVFCSRRVEEVLGFEFIDDVVDETVSVDLGHEVDDVGCALRRATS